MSKSLAHNVFIQSLDHLDVEDIEIEDESSSDDEPVIVDYVPRVVFNDMEQVIQGATITYAKIDVFNPPLPIRFGTWNDRELDKAEAEKLAKHMGSNFQPFNFRNLLPVILPREALDVEAYMGTRIREDAPMLKLSAAWVDGLADEDRFIPMAGGRHRVAASDILRDDLLQQRAGWDTKLIGVKERLGKRKEGDQTEGAQRLTREQEDLEQAIEDITVHVEQIGIWGVIIYERGKECYNARPIANPSQIRGHVGRQEPCGAPCCVERIHSLQLRGCC